MTSLCNCQDLGISLLLIRVKNLNYQCFSEEHKSLNEIFCTSERVFTLSYYLFAMKLLKIYQ